MRSGSDPGRRKRAADSHQTEKCGCHPGGGTTAGTLFVVGTGPGDIAHISGRALAAIEAADTIAGYTTYLELIAPLIRGKTQVSTGMMKEMDRVTQAIEAALSGRTCALVSGGDPGIYAMAGLVFELCMARRIPIYRAAASPFSISEPGGKRRPVTGEGRQDAPPQNTEDPITDRTQPQRSETGLTVEIIPGIPALAAGAALAGAPLTHDFAAISLSDLLTPWHTIEKRLTLAAQADFVLVLYNPKSKKRDWQLNRAREIILAHRDGATPVAVVTAAMRHREKTTVTRLADLHTQDVGMQTTIFIGATTSCDYMNFMFTPRGYTDKYRQIS